MHERRTTEITYIEGLVVIVLAFNYDNEDLTELMLGLYLLSLLDDFLTHLDRHIDILGKFDG